MTDPRLQPHKHKVALITGGCGGLGKVIADAFLACGADVVVCDINPSLIASFNQNLAPVYPGSTLVLECDVTDDAAIERMFDAAELKFGRVDYVVNNAGMIDRFDPVGEMEREAWDRVLALNLTAPAMVTKRGVNGMLRGNVKGVVVNIGSIAGVRGFTNGMISILFTNFFNISSFFAVFRFYSIQFNSIPSSKKLRKISHIQTPQMN